MNILGLHFGHDAGASVVIDGIVKSCVLRERLSRIKHAISLDMRTIESALAAAGLAANQIDLVAITSTQDIELIIDDPSRFQVLFSTHPDHSAPCTLVDWMRTNDRKIEDLVASPLLLGICFYC